MWNSEYYFIFFSFRFSNIWYVYSIFKIRNKKLFKGEKEPREGFVLKQQ